MKYVPLTPQEIGNLDPQCMASGLRAKLIECQHALVANEGQDRLYFEGQLFTNCLVISRSDGSVRIVRSTEEKFIDLGIFKPEAKP